METASEVLLIIVSATLAVFLILASVVLLFWLRIARRVNEIIARAENVADTVEAAASAFKKTAAPLAILKFIGNIINQKRKKG